MASRFAMKMFLVRNVKVASELFRHQSELNIRRTGRIVRLGAMAAIKSFDLNLSFIDDVKDKMMAKGKKVAGCWSFTPNGDSRSRLVNPDAVLSVPAIIVRNGYPCETHTVISDGYLLNVHRIPHSKNDAVSSKTVLLQHGLFCSSADWILNGPGKGLAYVLSDAGYDVWMSNVRGNRHSREHAWLKTGSKAYWNFSWHDVAVQDLPAVIDHIMKVKGEGTKITYIGHSMGTTVLFVMLSLRPEYNNILAAGFALAPVAFFSDVISPLKPIAPLVSKIAHMEMMYGSHEFIPKKSALGKMINIRDVNEIDAYVIKNIAFYICGANEKQFNEKLLPMFLANIGTGTSWKTVVHFAQGVVSGGKFQQFDYESNNQRMYGSDRPPEYDLSKVTLPLTLFWANNDLLCSENDVKLLSEKLPIKPEMYLVRDPQFSHLDYIWSIDADTLLNNKILESLNKVY